MAETGSSVWKKLYKLFKSGPVVRHRIASSERRYEPQGTAAAYKKELSSLYVSALASYGQYERLARYADFSEMEFSPEIASALDIYADEVTALDEKGRMINIESKDEEIKAILETLFFEIINIEFNLWSWVRNLCKYGDFILFVDASEDNGVLNLLPIPINEIEREEGFDKNDPFAVRFRWLTQGNVVLHNWQVVHFRLLGNDNFTPYGSSVIEPARRVWRQLILIEDAMLVYRIVRSPERRVFKIEVGNIKPDEVGIEIEKIQNRFKRNQVVDSTTGRVDLRYNPLSVDEDYYIPVRGGVGSSIESLPGGQFTGDIDDVTYIQNKLFAALKIPKAYLGYEAEVGSKSTLAQEDVRFSRTIQRIQKIVISELYKIALIHLYITGRRGEDLINFEIKMANPSTIAEQQKLELWRMKLEIAGTAQEGVLDTQTVYEDIFGLDDEKISRIRDGKKADKLEQLTIENMELPGEEPEAPEGPAPGEEQLPDTLGGEPPEAPPAAPPAPPEEGGELVGRSDSEILTDDEDLEEARNPGSAGDRAEIAVDKGKDLFSTSDDLYSAVFGRKKQTASDPFDKRSLKNAIALPVYEDEDFDGLGELADQIPEQVSTMTEMIERSRNLITELDNLHGPRKNRRR